jgi:hypothetical protein
LKEAPTRIVEFLLHDSILDKNPTIVTRERGFSRSLMVSDPIPEVLSQSSNVAEILWNFSRFKDGRRLTLKNSPHFYEKLPTSAEIYGGLFLSDPTDPNEIFHHDKISILTDNSGLTGRVFLEAAKKERIFGNVWVLDEAIIFKGSYLSVFLFLTP